MYASEGLFGSGETNPLILSFGSAIRRFSVFVANNDFGQNFTDDVGDSETLLIPSSGGMVFALSSNGITKVEIASSQAIWNFAIDDVSFTPTTSAPEPRSLPLLWLGLVAAAVIRSKSRA